MKPKTSAQNTTPPLRAMGRLVAGALAAGLLSALVLSAAVMGMALVA
jgi:multisubunit Na+/H+ antiporter MnhC subunit